MAEEIKLQPFPARSEVVNVDRTATTAFIRYLQQVLDALRSTTQGIVDGDIPVEAVLADGSVDIDSLTEAFRAEIGALYGADGQTSLYDRLQNLRNEVEGLAQSASDLDGNSEFRRIELNSRLGTAEASIVTESATRASADSALAIQLTTLEATVNDDVAAAIAQEAIVRADEDSALAVLIDEVAVEVGDVSAGGLAKFEVGVAPTGIEASYQVALRATLGGSSFFTGMRFDLINEGSGVYSGRVAIGGDQIVFFDPNDPDVTFEPIVFEGGTAIIPTVAFRQLRSIAMADLTTPVILMDGDTGAFSITVP